MGIKQVVFSLFNSIAGIYLSIPKINHARTFLTILAYHRINYCREDFLFDEDVISCTPELFDLEMAFCKKYFTPITFSLLKECMENRGTLPDRPLIITFDDGYKDNFIYAFPVLRKYDIPATIFLTTGYIGNKELFWWDTVAYSLKSLHEEKLQIEINHNSYTFNLKSYGEKRESIRKLRRILKSLPNNQRNDLVEKIISLSDLKKRRFDAILDWRDVQRMSHVGIEFGSHTVTHSVLTQVPREELLEELRASKRTIEEHIGKHVVVFAYPYGREGDFNRGIEDVLKNLDYRFAVSYIEGINSLKKFNRFFLKRIVIDGIDLKLFKTKLAFSKILFHKNYSRECND